MKVKSDSLNISKGNGSGEFENSSGSNEISRTQMIAEAAYFHAERRGFSPDNDLADWLQAEADVNDLVGIDRE